MPRPRLESHATQDPVPGVRVACAGVFDGHRGPEAAEYAARHFEEHLRRQWAEAPTPEQALRRAFVSLDEAFAAQEVCGSVRCFLNGMTAESPLGPDCPEGPASSIVLKNFAWATRQALE